MLEKRCSAVVAVCRHETIGVSWRDDQHRLDGICKHLCAEMSFVAPLFGLFSFRRRSLNVTEPVTCYLFLFCHRRVIPPNCVFLFFWDSCVPGLLTAAAAAAHLDWISVALYVMHD